MAIAKKPENETVVNQNSSSIVDTMWDGWMNGIKMVYAYQQEVESLTLQAIERQKELWIKTTANLDKMEQEMKNFLQEFKLNYQNNVKNIGGEQAGRTLEDWQNRLDEIAGRIQQLTWTPGKAGISVLTKSNEQVETAIKNLIAQQQTTREEVQSLMNNFVGQLKSTQKGILETVEVNKNNTINMFK
jgi:polyhydroxyalkanoic acid inclusion protein PhaP